MMISRVCGAGIRSAMRRHFVQAGPAGPQAKFAEEPPGSLAYADLPRAREGVVCLTTGHLALACNPVAGNRAARTPLSLFTSSDNGESWQDRIELESEAGEFYYPAVVATETGPAISYTWNRRRIAVARIAFDGEKDFAAAIQIDAHRLDPPTNQEIRVFVLAGRVPFASARREPRRSN